MIPTVDVDRARLGIAEVAAAHPQLRLVVLFGSVARGRATPRSDVDLGVLADGACDLDALYVSLAPVLKSDRLDLVDLRRAGPILAFAVARDGAPLFEGEPGTWRQFQSLAQRRYADTAKLRRAQERALAVFIERSTRA